MSESLSISVGECIATFVNTLSNEKVAMTGDSFWNDEQLLGEPTPKVDRGERFPSADGTRDVIMQSAVRAGQRDITFLLGPDDSAYDKILSWAQSRIQVIFDFEFYFKYNSQSAEGARIHRHKRCFFVSPPIPSIERGKGYVTARIDYGDLAVVNPSTGAEI